MSLSPVSGIFNNIQRLIGPRTHLMQLHPIIANGDSMKAALLDSNRCLIRAMYCWTRLPLVERFLLLLVVAFDSPSIDAFFGQQLLLDVSDVLPDAAAVCRALSFPHGTPVQFRIYQCCFDG